MKKHDTTVASPSSIVLTSGALAPAAWIPTVPEGYKPLDGVTKNTLLKVASEQRAEIDQAMQQLWEERESIGRDLGTLAPDAEKGKALHDRLQAAREANRKAQALAIYTDEQEALANHAVLGHLNTASGDIQHMMERNPQLASRYAQVLAVSLQRGEAIAAGIARARASKAEELKKG